MVGKVFTSLIRPFTLESVLGGTKDAASQLCPSVLSGSGVLQLGLSAFFLHDMRILLVEDHTDSRVVCNLLLNRCGCHTVVAKNFSEALSRLKEMRFDFLVADLNLPDGDGIELVREAKRIQPLKAIAVTGRTSEEEREAGLRAGFDSYLTKPIDFHVLREALHLDSKVFGPLRILSLET